MIFETNPADGCTQRSQRVLESFESIIVGVTNFAERRPRSGIEPSTSTQSQPESSFRVTQKVLLTIIPVGLVRVLACSSENIRGSYQSGSGIGFSQFRDHTPQHLGADLRGRQQLQFAPAVTAVERTPHTLHSIDLISASVIA